MARLIAGLGVSHTPSMSYHYDKGMATGWDLKWKKWYDGVQPVKAWFKQHKPDKMVVIYNDHHNYFDYSKVPTMAIGLGDRFPFADEGFGKRDFPDIPGDSAFSSYIARSLMSRDFDLTFCQELEVDHGVNSWYPYLFDVPWTLPIVPIAINFTIDPIVRAERMKYLGECLRDAIAAYDSDERIVILSTGGMSHQLHGSRFGLTNQRFDRYFLDTLETGLDELMATPVEKIQKVAGTEAGELLMWYAMRAALGSRAKTHYSYYTLPGVTGCGIILLEQPDG
ncbi:DODA-type extradiol aromatic ring-opening family dioxygenase [Porticoccus sp. GXU_MW_L64]